MHFLVYVPDYEMAEAEAFARGRRLSGHRVGIRNSQHWHGETEPCDVAVISRHAGPVAEVYRAAGFAVRPLESMSVTKRLEVRKANGPWWHVVMDGKPLENADGPVNFRRKAAQARVSELQRSA